ncbi:MAG: hypothetical protein ACRECN_04925 [Methylocella sp.]
MELDFSMLWHGRMVPVKARVYRSFKGAAGVQLDGAIFNDCELSSRQLELLIVALRQLRDGVREVEARGFR